MFIDLSKALLWCMYLSLLELIYRLNFIPIRKEWAGNIRQITLSHNLDKYLQIWHDLGQKWIIYKVNNADKTASNWSSIIRMHTASPCGFWDVVCKTTRNVQRTISRVNVFANYNSSWKICISSAYLWIWKRQSQDNIFSKQATLVVFAGGTSTQVTFAVGNGMIFLAGNEMDLWFVRESKVTERGNRTVLFSNERILPLNYVSWVITYSV